MLQVIDLSITFDEQKHKKTNPEQVYEYVHDVTFTIEKGEILGLVGESGSGKTLTSLTIAGLYKPGQVIRQGNILFEGVDLLRLSAHEMRKVQGSKIGMVFQEPLTALNPTKRIGKQVEEVLVLHTKLGRFERLKRVEEALRDVELEPFQVMDKFPHELSGGMRQRVMIASVIISRPKLLIADEPTTALDSVTQDAILQLLKKLNQKHKIAILLISHNLKVIRELCPRVLIMKNGEIVEQGNTEEIFLHPKHEYTQKLIDAIPRKKHANQ